MSRQEKLGPERTEQSKKKKRSIIEIIIIKHDCGQLDTKNGNSLCPIDDDWRKCLQNKGVLTFQHKGKKISR